MAEAMLDIVVDPTADAAYVTLSAEAVYETRELSPEVLVDLDLDGRLVGFELLRIQDPSAAIMLLVDRGLLSPAVVDVLDVVHPFSSASRFGLTGGHDGRSSRAVDLVPA